MNAQVSVEMIFAVAVVLLIAVVIGFFILEKNNESEKFFLDFSSKENCEKLSSIIYALSVSEAKVSVFFSIDSNVVISKGLIIVGNYYCDFLGKAQETMLTAGTFKAFKNSQGVVVFETQ